MRELIRGDVDPRSGQVGVSVWSDLPLNRVLYIPCSIFAYSSNIFISNLDLMDSIALGTLKNSRFFFNSYSFSDRVPVLPFSRDEDDLFYDPSRSCIVLLSVDLKDAYCSFDSHLFHHIYTYMLR